MQGTEGISQSSNRSYDQQRKYPTEPRDTQHEHHNTEDDTDSSVVGHQTDVESIFSVETTSTWQSSQSEVTSTAIHELARLLLNDDHLMGLYITAISKVGFDKFQRNFSRMLERYGSRLDREASNEIQREAAHFVRSSRRQTAIEVRIYLMENNPELSIQTKLEAAPSELARVNEWIVSSSGGRMDQDAGGDESSMDSDHSDSDSTMLSSLERVKGFLVSTQAFLDLRLDFQQWLESKRRAGHEVYSEKEEAHYPDTEVPLSPNWNDEIRSDAHRRTDAVSQWYTPPWWFRLLAIYPPPEAGYQRITYLCVSYLSFSMLWRANICCRAVESSHMLMSGNYQQVALTDLSKSFSLAVVRFKIKNRSDLCKIVWRIHLRYI